MTITWMRSFAELTEFEVHMDNRGTLSIDEVADFMGKSKLFVRRSIENGSLPIGCYTKEGTRCSYYISPKRAYEYLGYEREASDG